jgi:hypothetical protein
MCLIFFIITLLVSALAHGAPTATLDVQVVPAEPPSGIACANGQTPFSGSVPVGAENAGFTTCAYNGDFSNSFYATQSNYVDCHQTQPSLLWHNVFPSNVCNINQVTDPVTGGKVLRLEWLTSYGNSGNARLQEYATFLHTESPYLAFPNVYIEVVSRLDAESITSTSNCCGPSTVFSCQLNRTPAQVGIDSLEIDTHELYGGGNGFADAGAGYPGCGGTSTQLWQWFRYTTNNLPAGYSVTAYHKYGMLLTSDGSTDTRVCFFVDDILQGDKSTTPGCGSFSLSSPHYTYRNLLFLDLETSSSILAPVNQDYYVQYVRVWSCANWAGAPGDASHMCNGSTLVNNGQLAYWH